MRDNKENTTWHIFVPELACLETTVCSWQQGKHNVMQIHTGTSLLETLVCLWQHRQHNVTRMQSWTNLLATYVWSWQRTKHNVTHIRTGTNFPGNTRLVVTARQTQQTWHTFVQELASLETLISERTQKTQRDTHFYGNQVPGDTPLVVTARQTRDKHSRN